jgi:hypothetical protein
LTLLGTDVKIHDELTRTPGSWERAMAAMTRRHKTDATGGGVFVAARENIELRSHNGDIGGR